MTGITSNISTLIERFQGIAINAKNVDVTQALVAGVNAAMGEMKNRIFNEGLDTEGNSYGGYIGKRFKVDQKSFKKKKDKLSFLIGDNKEEFTPYEIKRIKAGRQVRYKDLEFTGNLRRDINIVTLSPTKVVCTFTSDENFLIAEGQERQISRIVGKEVIIFGQSQGERENMKTNITGILKQIYGNVLNA